MNLRIGYGEDTHRLVPERKLILGGVEIPYEKGLLGHSDADVLTHALMDAILGAAGLRDIGFYFPDRDPAYKDACSTELLKICMDMLKKEGFHVVNADAAIIAQAPKLMPYHDAICEKLSGILSCPVNVKATTPEGLGPEGRGEGITARVVCLLEKEE